MSESIVSVVRYEKPLQSVRAAVDLAGGLDRIPAGAKVFIKPNVVFWSRNALFPKWGVITTSRIVEDMVVLLKEHGIDNLTIGEGPALRNPKERETTPALAFRSLGYEVLRERYGLEIVNLFERPFKKVNLGQDLSLRFSSEVLESDFIVSLPVLKTHVQTVVSLGIKNLKGTIDFDSRKKCHSADPEHDLHYRVSLLPLPMPPVFTLIDGIYSLERGPNTDGRARRSNLLAASWDLLSADMVGARILGYSPAEVPYIAHAARMNNRPLDLLDIEVKGEKIEDVTRPHDFAFPYNPSNTLPLAMEKMGVRGLSYRLYDSTICTFCSGLTRIMLMAISLAWKGTPFPDVEVLTGKTMRATPGMRKTILLGKCMCEANKDDPGIREMIPVKGCPPDLTSAYEALVQAGIGVGPELFENPDRLQEMYMKKYTGKPEFDEAFFTVA